LKREKPKISIYVFEIAQSDRRFFAENQPYCGNPFDNKGSAYRESI
jgi:hypothetical protein